MLLYRSFEIYYLFSFHVLSISNHSDLILHKNICERLLTFSQCQLIWILSSQIGLNLVWIDVNHHHVIVFFLDGIDPTAH